jgi:hypothetical protein
MIADSFVCFPLINLAQKDIVLTFISMSRLKRGKIHNLSIQCQLDLFDKIIKSILLYGCEVWGFSKNEIIERVQLRFCKLLLNFKTSTPSYMVYGELGRFLSLTRNILYIHL